jgi:hypothetical protein
MQDEKTNDLKFALAKACTPLLDVGKTRTYDDDMFKLYPEDLHGLVHARKCKGNLLKLASLVNDKISTIREILTIYEHDASIKDPSDRSPIFEIAVKLYAKIGDESIIADFFNFDGIEDTVDNRKVFQDAVQSLATPKKASMSRKAHPVPAEPAIAIGRVAAAAAGGRKKKKEKKKNA